MFCKRILINIMKNTRNYYNKNIMEHYNNPLNIGSLDSLKKTVGTGLVGAPACGDVMKLQIEVKDGKIVDAKFKTFGCGSAIASSSYGSEYIKGKNLEDAYNVSNQDIANNLKLPPVKLHCSMLMEDAIKAAINNYKNKNQINHDEVYLSSCCGNGCKEC